MLQIAAASTLGAVTSAWPNFQKNPFTLGVASGSPTHDSVVLWTRLVGENAIVLAGRNIAVRWEVAHDEHFKSIVQKGQAQATDALGHSVHVEVQNLSSSRWYFYRFMVGDATSRVGRTRTLAKIGTTSDKLRIAFASCQRWEAGYFTPYKHMMADSPDMVLFLGDYIYEYPGNPVSSVRPPSASSAMGFVLTLDDYRARYAQYKTDPDLQAMHAACPWLLTWDDHEVQNDYAGLTAGNSGVADVFSNPADFAKRRAAAYQAYYENMPLRLSSLVNGLVGLLSGAEFRLYQRVDVGQLASFYMLDTRQYRDRQVCSKNAKLGSSQVDPNQCAAWVEPKRTLLGMQQEVWLNHELARSKQHGARWNVLGQSTLFGLRDNKAGTGESFFNDGWDGYSAARSRLTDALQKHQVENPVILGGDVHENWVGYVKSNYAQTPEAQNSKPIGVEFCGTSVTSPAGSSAVEKTTERLVENPHFIYADAASRGYGLIDFTPNELHTTLRVVEDARLPISKVATMAQFVVQAGRARIERV